MGKKEETINNIGKINILINEFNINAVKTIEEIVTKQNNLIKQISEDKEDTFKRILKKEDYIDFEWTTYCAIEQNNNDYVEKLKIIMENQSNLIKKIYEIVSKSYIKPNK
jgi:hypothetical protein